MPTESQYGLAGTTELRRVVARNAGAAMASYGLLQVLYFAIYVVLARLTTPAVFGAFAAGSILLSTAELFTESGMSAALLQRQRDVDAAAVTAFLSMSIGGLLLSVIALALSPLVGLFFHSHEIGLVGAVMSGYLVLNGLTGVPAALLQKRFAFRRWVVEPVAVAAYGAMSATGLVVGLGVWALVAGSYAASVTRLAGFWIAAAWKPNLRLASMSMWRTLAGYARHVLASELLREMMRVGNTAFIGRFLGAKSLGQFRFGWRLVSQVTNVVTIANGYTLQPSLVRLANEPARMRSATLSAFRLVSTLAFPLAAAFIPFSTFIAVLLFGERWRGVGPIMLALAGMGIAQAMVAVPAEVFKATNRPDILPRMHGLYAVSSIALIASLVWFGAVAVAAAWTISTVCVALYALARVPRVLDIALTDLTRAIVPALLSALAPAIALLLFNRYVLNVDPREDLRTVAILAAEVAIGTVLYLVGMVLLARETLREFRYTVSTMIGRRRSGPVQEPGVSGVL